MSDKSDLRKKLFVEAKVQGALALRVALYWMIWLSWTVLLLLPSEICARPGYPFYTYLDGLFSHYQAAMAASVVLLPLLIIDVVRLSNRYVGPLMRLRQSMRQLARGEHVEPIKFRKGDFWREFADEFNDVLTRVQGSPIPPPPATPEAIPEEELAAVG
jgi:hypothetical protein